MKKLVIVLVVASCSLAFAGQIAQRHAELYKDRVPNPSHCRQYSQVTSDSHGISEIGLERTACFGSCPVYSVIIKKDGSVRYIGEANVPHKGTRTGKVKPVRFNMLAHFIRDSDYMKLDPTYNSGVSDMPTVYTKVIMSGKEKLVRNYANAGPSKLWAIEELIDDLVRETEWK